MIIAANLKANLTREATASYIQEVQNYLDANDSTQEVFIFPATSSLGSFSTQAYIGAQNAYPAKSGAFTGEIGSEHLEEFDIKTILIGHSERRHVMGETQNELVTKFNFYKELGFKIIYCVGEPLEKREAGKDEMMEYISMQYDGIDTEYENLIIAYEPVWAIGTGLTPTLQEIAQIHKELKTKSSAPLLYGGSVKVNNAKEVLELDDVDGVLVGSAALNSEDFCKMIEFAQEINSHK